MKLCGLLLLSLIAFGAHDAAASEYHRHTGILIRDGNNAAVLLADDGNTYRLPDISRGFLDRHEGRRVTFTGPASLLTGTGGERRVIYSEEIVVTAPAERNGSGSWGTEAAETAQIAIPPLIPPF